MKVESLNDVQKAQSLDKTVSGSHVQAQVAVQPAIDDMGMLFSQQVELSSKTLGARQIGVRVSPVEQLSQLYDQLGHPAQESLASASRRARIKLLQNPSIDSLLELTGNDPARAYVVLKYVMEDAQTQRRETEANLARDAQTKLEIRYSEEIQAAMNTAKSLLGACDHPQLRQTVRLVYYACVVKRQSLASMIQELLRVFGDEEFSVGLNLMRRLLADDIAAHRPSVATDKLRTLLLGLQSCGQLSSVLFRCQGLIQSLLTLHPEVNQDAVVLLQRLLGYASAGITPTEVQRLASELAGGQVTSQLIFLNTLYPLIQLLPLSIWVDNNGRQKVLNQFLLVMSEYARSEGAVQPVIDRPRTEG